MIYAVSRKEIFDIEYFFEGIRRIMNSLETIQKIETILFSPNPYNIILESHIGISFSAEIFKIKDLCLCVIVASVFKFS